MVKKVIWYALFEYKHNRKKPPHNQRWKPIIVTPIKKEVKKDE